jgi:ABC-type multidrug transport system fused ATPase/permease subunit
MLDFAWQETENSGNKMKRIDKGADGVQTTIRRIFDVLIQVCVNLIGVVLIFATLNKLLALSLIFFIITYFLIGYFMLKRAVGQEKVVNKGFENLGGITFESLNNIQTIKSLSIDEGIKTIVEKHAVGLISEIKKRIFYFQSRNGVLFFYENLFQFLGIAFLGKLVLDGSADLGLLVLFISLFGEASGSTRELTDVTQELSLAKIWISRAMAILRIDPSIEHPDKLANQSVYPDDWKKLEIRNLRFTYGKKDALHNISLTIHRSEKVGIVGLSGAGKSTLFKLLLDLYEDYEGDIVLDNISLKDMQRQSFIDHVAVVLQDTELFDMSLRENIEIANVGSSKPKLHLDNVIHMAHLDMVVADLPEGVNTIVGEKGIKLSGGQRQRLGIARALYRDPDILLLDEATSHLDAHSEIEIQKALQENMHKFTTIVIAHRLSTIKAMDKIVVLEQGKILEQGSFDELLAKKGTFAKMWQEQKI